MGKTKIQKQLIDKTPNTEHLYENYEVQEVISEYTKDLESSSLNSDLGTGKRLKEVSDGTLLLTPRDINREENTSAGYDFANNASKEVFNNQTFQMETHVLDNLTPRLREFQTLTESETLRNSGKKVNFVVPMVNDGGYHWYGAIITFDPDSPSENKYSYTFLDSLKNEAGHCPNDIREKIENTFGKNIVHNAETRGFYQQPSGSLSCGACLSANLMMNTGVIPGEHRNGVDIDLRKEHFRMVPDMGWRNQPPTEAIADALYLLNSKDAKSELLDAAQNGTRDEFVRACSEWEQKLPDQKDLIVRFRSSVHTLCFDSRYNRKGKIDQLELNARLDQLELDFEQKKRIETTAKKFVTYINSADITGTQDFLASVDISDLKKMQQSPYYKENVNLDSPEGQAVDNIVNSYLQNKTSPSLDSKKLITKSVANLSNIHESIMNPTQFHDEPQQEKRIEEAARKFVMHLNAADLNGAQGFLVSTSASDLSKVQQSKYYKENVNLGSPEGKAINDSVNCYVKDKLESTPESKQALDRSVKDLIKTIAKKLNSILKTSPSKTNKPTINNLNKTQGKYRSSGTRSM